MDLENYMLWATHPGSQLKDHIYGRSRRLFAQGDAARDALRTPAAVRRRQAEVRRFLIGAVGGLPPAGTPLNARITGTMEGDGFTLEKIIFESRPHHYVTAHLYLPAARKKPTGAVLFLCGHHAAAKQQPEYQQVCQALVRAGLVVLAQDPIGQGERLSYYEPGLKQAVIPACTRDHDYAGAQCRFAGDALARYFLHDAMRSIDYLATRPEVDAARIGVTGNSGGGTQASLVMLADPRVAAAAPATFIMSRESYQPTGQSQDAEQIWPGFTRAGFDHEDILLAMAPKPVCVLAVTGDFFPIEGTRRTVARARRIWKLFKRPGALELVEDTAGHAYTPALARAAARFFARHLRTRAARPAPAKTWPAEILNCTVSGQVRAEFSDAEFVFDANLARSEELAAARRRLPAAKRKARAKAWLRRQVFRDRQACDLNPRVVERALKHGDLEVDIAFWWSQPGLANLGMLAQAPGDGKRKPVTLAVWDDGTRAIARHDAWLRAECGQGRAVFVLDLSGIGALKPDRINPHADHEFYGLFHKLSDDLAWIGDSLVALRTHEVLRALQVLPHWPGLATGDLRLYAHGRMGVHGRLAAALEPRLARCTWEEGFSFSDFVRTRAYDAHDVKSFILPDVLDYFDIDEL